MEQKKIILVTGIHDIQGESVARFLLEENIFSVRCLTNNPGTAIAIKLKKAGAEIVKGDMDNITSLSIAMADVYGVFGATDAGEDFDAEYRQGKNLILAVVASKVNYFIYSSFPAAEKISGGKFVIPRFTVKATLQQYAKSLKPDTSFVHVSNYYDDMLSGTLPQKADDGIFYWQLPQGDSHYASCAAADIGGVVSTMFRHPQEYKARTVGIVGADMHCGDYAAILSQVLRIPVQYKHVSPEEYASFGFPGAEELSNIHAFNNAYVPQREIDLIESYGLHPRMQTFEAWAIRNKELLLHAFCEQEIIAI